MVVDCVSINIVAGVTHSTSARNISGCLTDNDMTILVLNCKINTTRIIIAYVVVVLVLASIF
jgi:hypothetical protein